MATYTVATTTARQDAALAYRAKKEGQTVPAYLDAWWQSFLGVAVEEFVEARSAALADAYLAADQPTRQQVNTLLGL